MHRSSDDDRTVKDAPPSSFLQLFMEATRGAPASGDDSGAASDEDSSHLH